MIDTGAAWPTSSSFLPLLRESLAPLIQQSTGDTCLDPITALTDIVLTHRHADHIGGLKSILQVFNDNGLPQPSLHKYPHIVETQEDGDAVDWDQLLVDDTWPNARNVANLNWLKHDSKIPLQDGHLGSEGTTLRIIHTPGHTPDSISLMVEETGELFTADTVLGWVRALAQNLWHEPYLSSLPLYDTDKGPACLLTYPLVRGILLTFPA